MSSDSTHTIQTGTNLGNIIRHATYTVAIYIQKNMSSFGYCICLNLNRYRQ